MRILTRRRGEEDGATAIIVVLCMIALFGMIVLVVDVGGLLLRRRAMVNGADAAALAVAKTCILPVAADPRTPEQASDEWAATNVNGVNTAPTNIVQIAGCDVATGNGYVSVRYDAPQQLFFAPVLGYSDQGTVSTTATAIWGAAGAANVVPIIVYANAFNNCKLDTDPTPTERCYIMEDNSQFTGSQNRFGWLDLDIDRGWDVARSDNCTSVPANDLRDWINDYPDPDIGDLPINYPAPTYVCAGNGNKATAWAALEALKGRVLFFPMNRCYPAVTGSETDGQLDSSNTPEPCGGTTEKYDVIGYAAFRLVEIYDRNELLALQSTQTCTVTLAFPTSSPLNLRSVGVSQCGMNASASIDASSVLVSRIGGGSQASNPTPVAPPGGACPFTAAHDYCYDSATEQILWNGAGPIGRAFPNPRNYTVRFQSSVGGPCGPTVPPDNAVHCLVVDYVDKQVGGSRPGQGDPNSNVIAYKLCEPSVPSTCAPITVPVP